MSVLITSCETCCKLACLSLVSTMLFSFFNSLSLFETTNHMHDISSRVQSVLLRNNEERNQ